MRCSLLSPGAAETSLDGRGKHDAKEPSCKIDNAYWLQLAQTRKAQQKTEEGRVELARCWSISQWVQAGAGPGTYLLLVLVASGGVFFFIIRPFPLPASQQHSAPGVSRV